MKMKKCLALLLLLTIAPSGLAAQRVPWTTSRVVGSPDPPKEYHVARVYPKLRFNHPVELMPLADTGKMMLLEVDGKLYTFDDDPDVEQAELVLDVRPLIDGFSRALGFGVHPNFAENRQIFIVFAGSPIGRKDGSRLSRFVMSENTASRIDPAGEEILLTWHSGGHNGCAIRFDSSGYLYFSTGDGARPFPPDEFNVSQDLTDLRSSICRIDVDHREGDRPYAIPRDNPFVDTPGARPEIFAYGFRNPWRFTVDPETDRVFCGDVGWELWELVFDVRSGGNYGWSITEGPQPIRSDLPPGPTPISKPLVAYPHAMGQSVTGGIVYRGSQHPGLNQAFLYGDYVTGLLWGVRQEEDRVTWNPLLAETGLQIVAIAESAEREVLIVDYDGGIYQLVKNPAVGKPSDFPRRLSETGLFESTRPLVAAAGVIPYDLAAESWQHGMQSDFWVAIPGTETININARHRSWNYPAGTVFVRTISAPSANEHANRLKLETQLLHFDGRQWQPYSFAWNRQQTDAMLVESAGGAIDWWTQEASGSDVQSWQIQNRAQCRVCHSTQSGGAVGFTLANLDHPTSGTSQVDRLVDLQILDRRAPKNWNVRPMVDPRNPSADMDTRARSYLAANCGHCHSRGGGGTVPLELTFVNKADELNAIDVKPTQGSFGINDARVIVPGDPYRSVLFYRIATSGTGHMPKLASHDNDVDGLKLVHDWILSLDESAASQPRPTKLPEAVADTSDSLRLLGQLLFDESGPAMRLTAAKTAAQRGNVVTAAIFERFLPPDQRRQRLGEHIDPQQILEITGNAPRGREILTNPQRSQCTLCHRIQGSGQSVGPDLDGIASKRSREHLLTSILRPSAEIEPQYSSHAVLTDAGQLITGLKVDEDDELLLLRQADGKDQRIAKDEIESLKIQPQSLMPAGLVAELTAQELADLLEFLTSLK